MLTAATVAKGIATLRPNLKVRLNIYYNSKQRETKEREALALQTEACIIEGQQFLPNAVSAVTNHLLASKTPIGNEQSQVDLRNQNLSHTYLSMQ
jgi:hypothetical protein